MEKRLATWMTPESNRWSFTHVREVIPTARIARGEQALDLGESTDGALGPQAQLPESGTSIEQYLADTHTDSIVVLSDGQVRFEHYREGKAAEDLHINFSVSKSLTGLVAWALASEGAFSFTDRVADHVPEVAGSAYDVKVQSLFDMAVPLDFSEDYAMGDPRMLDYRRSTGWIPGESDGLHAFLPTLQRRADEGTQFHYASPTTDMAGWLLERVSGRRLAELYSTYVWQPIGAASDADLTVDAYGAGRAAGGVSCTTRDLARVGHHLTDGGGVFGEALLRDLHSGDAARWQAYANITDFPRGSYRNFWYVPDTDAAVLYGVGIHGQGLYIDVERRIVIAKHSSWPVPITDALHTAQYRGFRDLTALVRD